MLAYLATNLFLGELLWFTKMGRLLGTHIIDITQKREANHNLPLDYHGQTEVVGMCVVVTI